MLRELLRRQYYKLVPELRRKQIYKFLHPSEFKEMRTAVYPSKKGNFSLRNFDREKAIFIHIISRYWIGFISFKYQIFQEFVVTNLNS